jgi:hypothetical protein
MASVTLKSALVAMTMVLTATAAPQCNTNADCLEGYICGVSDATFGTPVNVCVALDSCFTESDAPNYGPKCGDSIFCQLGSYCGGGYGELDGERVAGQVCVNRATGIKCARGST